MQVSDDYKCQVSIKFGPKMEAMLNLRADTPGELDRLARESCDIILGGTAGLVEELGAISNVQQQFPQTAVATQPAVQQQPQQQQSQSYNAPRQCLHGQMQERSGADWHGWFCPLDKTNPNRCKPQYDR